MKSIIVFTILSIGISFSISDGQAQTIDKIVLKNNWSIQSSMKIKEKGKTISQATYKQYKWYPTTVPSTVLGTLVDDKVYSDPYYGTNFVSIPGFYETNSYYRDGKKKTLEPSPFDVPWWYRTVFNLPPNYKRKSCWLKFHSINYRANIWLNGHLIADTTAIEGAYRLYNLNITKFALPGDNNCLALEVFPPKGNDLTITWSDWNPIPPDRAMGIWYEVTIRSTGPVAIENPHVITDLDLPSVDTAKLTISAEIMNSERKSVSGILRGKIENIKFSQKVTLEPNEKKIVTFSSNQYKGLLISHPRLWWPHTVGPQNLYDLNLTFENKGAISDFSKTRFGIRKITSWMNTFDGKRTRVFQINGKNILIRGAGYVQDLMLRQSNDRIDADIHYAKHMNLNALRMEGPRGSDYLFDKCDEEGIMLIVGWMCGTPWEGWESWTNHTADIAEKSWHDQIVHLRNHPSIIDWLYGSDTYPPAHIENRYIKVIEKFDGTRPYQSSATQKASEIAGYTGLYMGPYPKVYSYEPPSFWYGKLEFNTEAGPAGEQISPIESMRKMMSKKDLWPISNSWNIRERKPFYPDARNALNTRYGKPTSVEEYCVKSQVLQYESTRAMFEAFACNKYRSSGIFYWMLNSAWPTLYWQLYDYYLTPNGAFYGTKKACEPLHIQYSYEDSSIYIVNEFYKDFKDLKVTAKLYNFNLEEKYAKEVRTNITSDESKKVITLNFPKSLSNVFFLKLELKDSSNQQISSNFYWLSAKGDEKADFTDLNKLPKVNLKCFVSPLKKIRGKYILTLELENPSSSLAFSINPKIIKAISKDLVLPVFWEDNYFSLMPKEKRKVKVEFNAKDMDGEDPVLRIDGWNIISVMKKIKL
jgi:exo-1,4-beta-D-glucosaminidase